MTGVDSVLLIAFGGPERPEDIRPFLEIVTAGRRIPPERIEEVARHYEAIGGRSPLNELTQRQAGGLRRALEQDGSELPVYVGMRNWHPFLLETLGEMRDRGHRRALGIILSSFQTEASWERYVADVAAARDKLGPSAPEVSYAAPFGAEPLFVKAMAERTAAALDRVPARARANALLVFTAHSVPAAMASGSPYARQFEAAALVIAGRLDHPRWRIAYQSRSGAPGDAWLEPDICDVLRGAKGQGIEDAVIVPVGFVCDHVEVLYDLDVEARAVAAESGLRLHRAETANDHPAFIAMLADLVKRAPR
jgi:ferrochelatase